VLAPPPRARYLAVGSYAAALSAANYHDSSFRPSVVPSITGTGEERNGFKRYETAHRSQKYSRESRFGARFRDNPRARHKFADCFSKERFAGKIVDEKNNNGDNRSSEPNQIDSDD
jgi:hypothetical protein